MDRYPEEFLTDQLPSEGKICDGLNWSGIYSLCDGTKFQNFVDFAAVFLRLPLFAIKRTSSRDNLFPNFHDVCGLQSSRRLIRATQSHISEELKFLCIS
jgi:hypothetical protein